MPETSTLHPAALALLQQHWAIEPHAQDRILRLALSLPHDAVLPRADFWTDEEDGGDDTASATPPKKAKKPYEIRGGVALLRLEGILQKRPDLWTYFFPGEFCATATFAASLNVAANDPDVTALLLLVDSPGGTVDGTEEAGDAVYAARQAGKKPLLALATDLCCSAAYWIASQAPELYVGASAWSGSIGTRLTLLDASDFYATMGLKWAEIASGTYKAAGANTQPLTDEMRAYFQEIVDRTQVQFTAAVARGRKLPIADVRALAKEARVYVGADAETVGLVDGVLTVPEVLARLQQQSGAKGVGKPAAESGKRRERMDVGKIRDRILAVFADEDKSEENGAASSQEAALIVSVGTLQAENAALTAQLTALTTERDTVRADANTTQAALTALDAEYTEHLRAEAATAAIQAYGPGQAAAMQPLLAKATRADLQATLAASKTHLKDTLGITDTQPGKRKSTAADPKPGAAEGAENPGPDADRLKTLMGLTPLGRAALKNGGH